MKTALVTGGTGGIGRAITEQLIEEGYTVYVHYNQNHSVFEEWSEKYREAPVIPLQADLSNEQYVNQLVNEIVSPIDVLVVASGNASFGFIQDIPYDELQRLMMIHLTSPFVIIQRLLPKMIQRKKGSIIFISSIWGETGAALETAYSMVKGGQNALVKALAKEVAPSGIRVNAIAPGFIHTKMNNHLSPDELQAIEEEIPLGRGGEPEEIAKVVSFLAGEGSSYITGQILSVNGGWHC